MSLNCPHAWEEYKTLDTAYHNLRREYLMLREEQTGFSNVPKDWLVRMRGLWGKYKKLQKLKDDFSEDCARNNLLYVLLVLQKSTSIRTPGKIRKHS